MDASAYLKRQGWRGDGHSLDHSNRGIKKPLLVAKKVDVLGVGLDKHKTVSDQWWLRAFDQGLKSLGTGEESVLATVQKHGVHRGGLYGRFVKGERIAGSIGQTPQSSEEDTTSGTNTPAHQAEDTQFAMGGVDIPPADKLERVVGEQADKNSHDAMMYLLQHPEAAPASMKKLLDRKRKRAETANEKRARRKIEHHEKRVQKAKESRKQAIEEGTWDAEKEEDTRRQKEINRQADQFVLEAQRRGVIPLGPNEIRKGIVPIPPSEHPNDELQHLFDRLAMKNPFPNADPMKPSLKKTDRYLREKMKRQLKAAAKAYLMGEKLPHEQTHEDKQAKKDEKKLLASQKRADTAQREAEKIATREKRAEEKRERRAKRKVQKEKLNKIIEERDAAIKAGKTSEEFYAELAERDASSADSDEDVEGGVVLTPESDESTDVAGDSTANQGDAFQAGIDEVKLGMNRKGNKKKIPGVGAVDRYPTKAEKKAKKLKALAVKNRVSEEEIAAQFEAEKQKKLDAEQVKIDTYRALKHGMTLEGYRAALERGEVHSPFVEKRRLPPEKLAEYKQRAAKKGVKLEDYIRRRDEKSRSKKAEKLGNPFQQDLVDDEHDELEYIEALPEQPVLPAISGEPSTDAITPTANGLGFVMDTEGDPALAGVNFQANARAAIRASKQPLAIIDTAGDVNYFSAPHMPVPLDPRIWEGQKVKDLPKHIRKARRDWMALKREEKKARATENGAVKKVSKKVNKAQRKIAARDAFVKQILFQSRTALRSTGEASGMVTIEGVENVPLVKVESRDGPYSKMEIDLARTAARRVLRNVKREQRAKDGKGKGWKKRERAEKEARRNAGISGVVNKARFDPGARGANKDLLL